MINHLPGGVCEGTTKALGCGVINPRERIVNLN